MKFSLLHLRWLGYVVVAGLLLQALLSGPPPGAADVVRAVPRRVSGGSTDSTALSIGTAAGAANRPSPGSAAGPISLQIRAAAPVLADPFAAPFAARDHAQRQALALARARAPAQPQTGTEASEPAPPLPFSFLGRWTEQGRTTVFLRRGDKTVAVGSNGRIDDTYQLRAINEQGLLIEHLPSRSTQTLRFDAPPAAAAKAGAAQAALPLSAAPPSDETVGEN